MFYGLKRLYNCEISDCVIIQSLFIRNNPRSPCHPRLILLPLIIEPKAQQLIDLDVAVELIELVHPVVVAQVEIDAGREEAADLEVERVLPLAGNAVIVGEVVEARGPGYVAVDVEREVGLDLRTELAEDVLVLVFALGQRLVVLLLLEAVAGEVHVRVVVAAIHIIKREGGDVHVERNVAVHHLGDFLRELVLHTETAVEGHRGEEGGEEAVAVHVVVLDYLGAEADVEGIEPLLESLVAEEGAEADEVVVHLVGVDRIGLVREGVHVELQF